MQNSNIENGVVTGQVSGFDVVHARVSPGSPYYESALIYANRRLRKLVGIYTKETLFVPLSKRRGQLLLNDLNSHIRALEDANSPDTAPRPPEKEFLGFKNDLTKRRVPTIEQELFYIPKTDNELRDEGGIVADFEQPVVQKGSGKDEEDTRKHTNNPAVSQRDQEDEASADAYAIQQTLVHKGELRGVLDKISEARTYSIKEILDIADHDVNFAGRVLVNRLLKSVGADLSNRAAIPLTQLQLNRILSQIEPYHKRRVVTVKKK